MISEWIKDNAPDHIESARYVFGNLAARETFNDSVLTINVGCNRPRKKLKHVPQYPRDKGEFVWERVWRYFHGTKPLPELLQAVKDDPVVMAGLTVTSYDIDDLMHDQVGSVKYLRVIGAHVLRTLEVYKIAKRKVVDI